MYSLVMLLLTACGPKLPPQLVAPYQTEHPDCPKATHLWSVGLGATPEDSVRIAKTNISESIQSNLKAEVSSITEEFEQLVVKDGVPVNIVNSQETARSVFASTTEFSHAELMKVVIQPMENKGKYSSLVCLNRKAAVDALMEDIRPTFTRFQGYADAAFQAFENDDISKFSSNFSKATKMREQLISELVQVRSLMGRKSNTEREMIALWKKLQEQSIELLEDITVGVTFTPSKLHTLDIGDQDILEEQMRTWLTEFGLNVNSQSKCDSSLTYLMSISYDPKCGFQPISNMFLCKPILHVQATNCSTKELKSSNLSADGWVGQSFQRDEKIGTGEALHSAFLQLKKDKYTEDFRSELHRSLNRILPIQK